VDERDVVVGGDAVAERRQPLVYALHHDLVRQAVAYVLQLLRGVREQRAQGAVRGAHCAVRVAVWCV
jgi:hypothetical protein